MLAVVALVGLLGSLAARQLAEREAVNDAAHTAGILAETVITPALTPGLLTGDAAAIAALDSVVRAHVLSADVVRVKVWSPTGVVLYADEPQLIGAQFALSSDQQGALTEPATRAEISALEGSENTFEKADQLVEVYRPVWLADGSPLLFEMYASYVPVGERTSQLWRGFAGVTVSSLILFVVLVSPLLRRLLLSLRAEQDARDAVLRRALDVSDSERQRCTTVRSKNWPRPRSPWRVRPLRRPTAATSGAPVTWRKPRPRCAPPSGRCAACWSTSIRPA